MADSLNIKGGVCGGFWILGGAGLGWVVSEGIILS